MGNRAVIQFVDGKENVLAVYLQWNGGPESIAAFIQFLRDVECRADAVPVRFCQVVGNFFGGDLSLYPSRNGKFDHPGDNGVYIVDVSKPELPVRHWKDESTPRSRAQPLNVGDMEYYRAVLSQVHLMNDLFFKNEDSGVRERAMHAALGQTVAEEVARA